jgi:hypothetical protein
MLMEIDEKQVKDMVTRWLRRAFFPSHKRNKQALQRPRKMENMG